MSEPAQKYENNCSSFKQIYTKKLLIAFKMACHCCFSFGGNLDFTEFLQKKICIVKPAGQTIMANLFNRF